MREKQTLKISTIFSLLLAIQVSNSFAQSLQISLNSTSSSCTTRDGIITATATGGTPPYAYAFNGGSYQDKSTWKGYGGHTYFVFVRDATGKSTGASITVKTIDPVLNFTQLNQRNATACNVIDGIAVFSATGGTPPYSFSMDMINYQPGNSFNNLAPGFYTFGVKDANGCTNDLTVTIFSSCSSIVTESARSSSLCDNPGYIEFTITNPSDYTYSIDGVNYQNTCYFNGLSAGVYTIYIKDANGVINRLGANILKKCEFTINPNVFNATCGNLNGEIQAIAKEGVRPYQFSIDGINFQNSTNFPGLAPGTYTITAKDATGLVITEDITIKDVCLSSSSFATDATCGNSNGTITVYASSGTPPYMYSKDGINFQTSPILSGVSQGNYTVTVQDARGAVSTSPATVNNIPGPQITATSSRAASCTNNDGTIDIAGTGGTTPYLYSITNSNFQNNSSFTRLSTGSYTAVVKDANGCLASQSVTVDLSNDLYIDAGPDATINEGETVTLEPSSNGTSFSWTPTTALNNASILRPDASPDVTTQYYVTAHGGICESTDSVSVLVKPVPISDFFVPNAFTPNSDGRNDLFNVKAVGIRQFKYFAVFNRWGQRVFYTTNAGTGWNGTINGKMAQAGSYVWMAAGISFRGRNIDRHGTVELIR